MASLVLYPTETSQWHALVNEAQVSSRITLRENTESYLVYLLMRFGHKAQLIESVLALDFLEASYQPCQQKILRLQEVGDKSLLFCGLFPGMARRRHVGVEYYMSMGRTAYHAASQEQGFENKDLFYQLSLNFSDLSVVLRAMRDAI